MIPNPKGNPTVSVGPQGNTIIVSRIGGGANETVTVKIFLVTDGMDGANPVATLNGASDANGSFSIPSGVLSPGMYHVLTKTTLNGQITSNSSGTANIVPPPPNPPGGP
jgi:hypothetical protein